MTTDLVLASGSATRRALLDAAWLPGAGPRFTVQVPDVDESAIKRSMRAAGETPAATALALAHAKAAAVPWDGIVIAADQILVCEDRWFDKPGTLMQAGEHLRALRGRTHRLETAVVCWRRGALWHHSVAPTLTMRAVSDQFIGAYVAAEGEACLGSVGGYRLEGPGIQLFSAVMGEHSAILGLPLLPLLAFLRDEGVLLR